MIHQAWYYYVQMPLAKAIFLTAFHLLGFTFGAIPAPLDAHTKYIEYTYATSTGQMLSFGYEPDSCTYPSSDVVMMMYP